MELPTHTTVGDMQPSAFKSYAALRLEIQEKEKEDERVAENELRSTMLKKIQVVLNRMAAQEKTTDFVEFPNLGPLNDTKISNRLNKIVAEMKAHLEKSDWVVDDKPGGFFVKRK